MLMDGKDLAKDIKIKLKNEIDDIKRIYGVTPAVASILVGDDPASQVYVNSQIKSYQDLGIEFINTLLVKKYLRLIF